MEGDVAIGVCVEDVANGVTGRGKRVGVVCVAKLELKLDQS